MAGTIWHNWIYWLSGLAGVAFTAWQVNKEPSLDKQLNKFVYRGAMILCLLMAAVFSWHDVENRLRNDETRLQALDQENQTRRLVVLNAKKSFTPPQTTINADIRQTTEDHAPIVTGGTGTVFNNYGSVASELSESKRSKEKP